MVKPAVMCKLDGDRLMIDAGGRVVLHTSTGRNDQGLKVAAARVSFRVCVALGEWKETRYGFYSRRKN